MAAEKPMDNAPTDGTHVLVKHQVYEFKSDRHGFRAHVPAGTQWIESWYEDGQWRLHGSRTVTPLAWAELPQC